MGGSTRLGDGIAALFAGVAGVAGSFALAGNTPAFVGAPVSAFVVAAAPAELVAFSIQQLGLLGDLLAFAFALVLTALVLGIAAFAGIALGRRLDVPPLGALLAALLAWGVATALTRAPTPSLGTALGVGIVAGIAVTPARTRGADEGRRRLLGALLGALGFSGLGYVVGERRVEEERELPPLTHEGRGDGGKEMASDEEMPDMRTIESLLAEGREKSFDVTGLPGLVTPIEDFYEVDINAVDPDVDQDEWTLRVTGEVAEELELTYDDLTSMPSVNRFKTLRCVGEGLNARLMSNAVWTAVPVMDVIERAGPDGACNCVMLRAADDYFEQFPLPALRTGLFAFGMNGVALPRNHGYPVRALIPGHWGEINVKWLTEIETLRVEREGFWEKRGWHGTGPVNTVAKLWAENRLDGGRLQVGGLAYAGLRGIERVEVSTDGGETWRDARLSEPLSGDDVWRQWAYEWRPSGGAQEVVVRATDGEGNLQPREESQAFPSGATGWVSRTIEP